MKALSEFLVLASVAMMVVAPVAGIKAAAISASMLVAAVAIDWIRRR